MKLIEPSEDVREMAKEILAQNRLILERNLEISRFLSSPPTIIEDLKLAEED